MAENHHPNYAKIYYALLILLVVSVAGPFLGIKWVTLITAFGIAVVKATLVVQNFMHLKWEKTIMKYMLATSVVLMFLLFAGVAPDVMKHEGTRWVNLAAQEAVARGISDEHVEEAEHVEEGVAEAGTPEAGESGPAAAAPAAQEFDPAASYAQVCSACHGPAGAGDGVAGAALDPKPADFSDPAFWEARTDELVLKAIREGGPAVGKSPLMAPWGALYNEAQAQALVEYLKTFRVEG